jgi:hypothetical protein
LLLNAHIVSLKIFEAFGDLFIPAKSD